MNRAAACLIAVLAVLAVCAGCGREALAPLDGWDSDYGKAKNQAAKEQKPLAVLFSAAWSKSARTFERSALADPKVRGLLAGYVRVRLDLDAGATKAVLDELKARDRNDYAGAPWLVLVSPQGERKHVAGQCSATELAEFLGTLASWQPLAGWESDPAKAETAARETRKPLAVLYSAAWETPVAAFERNVLTDERVRTALAGFTLLRLNFLAHEQRARGDFQSARDEFERPGSSGEQAKFYAAEAGPALFLPTAAGKLQMVPPDCSALSLVTAVGGLGGWKEAAGWRSDHEAAAKQAKAEAKPLALLLDAADWPSARFLAMPSDFPEVAKALEPFVKVRVEYGKVAKKERDLWQARSWPCLVLFDAEGKCRGAYGARSGASEPPARVAEKITDGLKLVSAPKSP